MKTKYSTLILAFLFVVLVVLVKTNIVTEVDRKIGEGIYSLHDQGVATLVKSIGMLGSTTGIISILFLFMAVFAFIEKSFVSSAMLFLAVLLGNMANKGLKAIIGRERPTFPQHIEDGYSFPSGHVMVGLLLFGMIAYTFLKRISNKKTKQVILFCTGLLIIVVGISRLLEGEHFLSDIIGGVLSGSLMLIGMIYFDAFVHKMIMRRKTKSDVAI